MAFVAILGTIMSAVSAISQGQQAADQAESAKNAEEYNAAVNRNKATNTRAVYAQKEDAQRRQARLIMGDQRAAGGQSGLGSGGSIADMENQSAVNAELDSLNIRYQGSLESQGLLAQADMNDYQGSVYGQKADNAITSSYLAAGSSILSGIGKYAANSAGGSSPKLVNG